MVILRVAIGVGGAVVVLGVLMSALRTVVLPRSEPVRLTAVLFATTRRIFDLLLKTQKEFSGRDRLMSHYAPVTLCMMPLMWLSISWLGFAAIFWAVEGNGVEAALVTSGSSLMTLGFDRPETFSGILVSFVEGALAISVLALLLVTYLPSMYNSFAEREQHVTLFEVRAGTPPRAPTLLIRYQRIAGLGLTDQIWQDWEQWFARISESHASLPALVFFRSPDPQQSWITAAGAVLDAAAMMVSVVDLTKISAGPDHLPGPRRSTMDDQAVRMPFAETMIRSGYLALRRLAQQFDLPHDPDPQPGDPISILREEFDEAYDEMAEAGVPLREDRDAAWRDWAGWRVNYDTPLLSLAAMTVAPPTPWISDRQPVSVPPRPRRRDAMPSVLGR